MYIVYIYGLFGIILPAYPPLDPENFRANK